MNYIEIYHKARNIKPMKLYLLDDHINTQFSQMLEYHFDIVTDHWEYCSDDVDYYFFRTFAITKKDYEIDILGDINNQYYHVCCNTKLKGFDIESFLYIDSVVSNGKKINHIKKLIALKENRKFYEIVDVDIQIMVPFRLIKNIKNGVLLFESSYEFEYLENDEDVGY